MATSSSAVPTAIIDIDTRTAFQNELHIPIGDETVFSPFWRDREKTTWTAYTVAKMPASRGEEDIVRYNATSTFDLLTASTFVQDFPALKVQPGYEDLLEICWPHNVTTNTILNGIFKSGDVKMNTLDRRILDVYPQLFGKTKSGWRKMYALQVGNTESAETWTNHLVAFRGMVDLPWYYCKESSFAFPLYYDRSAIVTHEMKVVSKIADLLKFRWRPSKSHAWCYTHPEEADSWEVFYQLIEGFGDGKLPQPEMWAKYAKLDQPELDEYIGNKNIDDDDDPERAYYRNERTYYAEDFITLTDDNTYHDGQTVTVKLASSTPCKSFVIVAENINSSKINNFSNYSTNIHNNRDGWCPIDSFSLYYGSAPRLKDIPSDLCTKVIAARDFLTCPSEVGYVPYPFSANTSIVGDLIGVIFSTNLGAELRIRLGDMNPLKKKINNKKTDIGLIFKHHANQNDSADRGISDRTERTSAALAAVSSSAAAGSSKMHSNEANYSSSLSSDSTQIIKYKIYVVLQVVRKIVFTRVVDDKDQTKVRYTLRSTEYP